MPKTKPSSSTGTLTLLLVETPDATVSGALTGGPNSPLSFAGAAWDSFTGGPTCGQPNGKKAAKAVKTGTLSGAVSF